MKFQIDAQEKYSVLTLLEEKLDSRIAPALKSQFLLMNAEGVRNLILDMREVRYADSSGLSALLIGNRLCQDARGVMIMTDVQDHVSKLVHISRLDDILHIFPTRAEAIEAVFLNELEGDFLGEDDTVDDDFMEDQIDDPEEAEDWEEESFGEIQSDDDRF